MKVAIPHIAVPEVEYTFHCLLTEFLGLQYDLEISPDAQDYVISKNGKNIVIKNHFFKASDPESWYQQHIIPSKTSNSVFEINNKKYLIHSIFGKAELEEKDLNYFLEADIIASTFFMLSRWEEAIKTERDEHGRFSAKNSIAFQNDFLQKPIVNEYIELLWVLLKKIGIEQSRKKRHFQIVPTHDVDIPFLFPSMFAGFRSIARHLISRASFMDGIHYLKKYFKGEDAYDTHGIFLEEAEKIGEKAHFFFMSGGKNKFDPRPQITHPKVKKLIEKIKSRGHHIGFHPSYETFKNPELFSEEKLRLEKITEEKVVTGRQHYLRFDIPATWEMWDDGEMQWDSSMGYSDAMGFRCGVCYPFPVFDFRSRKKLDLIEKPLLLMEVTLGLYLKPTLPEATDQVKKLMNEVKKYEGEFVFLWHNSSLNFRQFSKYNSILFDLIYNKTGAKLPKISSFDPSPY